MAAKELSIKERKEWAKSIYLAEPQITQKALAVRVGVSENTIGKWIKESNPNWDSLRINLTLTREEQYQCILLELKQLNQSIADKPEGKKFADAKEADARRKMIKDLKDLETKASISETVSVCSRIVNWLSKTDLETTKQVAEIFDAFIKENMRA